MSCKTATDGMSREDGEGLLFECLSSRDGAVTLERLAALSDTGWAVLLELAEELMVAPMLWHRLLAPAFKPVVPLPVRRTLAAEQHRVTLTNLRMHYDFRRVVLALYARDIPVLALKGMHLASLVYQNLAVRSMGDIDLLVRATDLAGAGAVLEELGYRPLSPYVVSRQPVPYSWHELPRFVSAGSTVVEIHWHILDPHAAPTTPAVDVDQLWDRAVWARVAGVSVQVLSPEDLLLHQCIHATYSHLCEFSARPWCDLAATIGHYGESLSWATVTERATAWHARRGTYLALRLASDLVQAGVPDAVLDGLKLADMDARILALAMRQRHRVHLPHAIAQLAQPHPPLATLRTWWSRVCLPRDALADMYTVSRTSRLVYVLYLIRLKDLVKHHWRTLARLYRGDPRLNALAADTVALREFLSTE